MWKKIVLIVAGIWLSLYILPTEDIEDFYALVFALLVIALPAWELIASRNWFKKSPPGQMANQ